MPKKKVTTRMEEHHAISFISGVLKVLKPIVGERIFSATKILLQKMVSDR